MAQSLPLWLRLRLGALRPAGPRAKAAAATAQRPEGAAEGPHLWIWSGEDTASAAALVARRMMARMPGLLVTLTLPEAHERPTALPKEAQHLAAPEDRPASMRLVLEAWAPDLILLVDQDLPASLISEAQKRAIPLVLADAQVGAASGLRLDDMTLSLLNRLERIYLRDAESNDLLVSRLNGPQVIVSDGALSEPPEPLYGSEAERASMAEAMGARPVWLATSVPEAELEDILAAHRYAQRHAHRLLLLLAPDRETDGAALAERLIAAGWAVARRSKEGEPEPTTEIFIADDDYEYGLWYRLAALSFMGGTLSGTAKSPRSPLEAAALGSAILHGPKLGPHREDYLRLEAAKACRGVHRPGDLPDAVADLISPKLSAMLAHNAWAVTSGGAGAVENMVRDLVDILARKTKAN